MMRKLLATRQARTVATPCGFHAKGRPARSDRPQECAYLYRLYGRGVRTGSLRRGAIPLRWFGRSPSTPGRSGRGLA